MLGTAVRPYRFGEMCKLYSITTNRAAIVALFRVINRYVGNLPPMPGGSFLIIRRPVVRNAGAERELATIAVPSRNVSGASFPRFGGAAVVA
jgi:hypothetical protein